MKKTLITIVSVLLVTGACWSDDLESNANEVKYYDNAKVVRIKSVEGEGFVQRSYDEGNEEAIANLPLFEKDTVGTTDGRLAVYLGRLNYLRLDTDSVVVLEKIPQLRQTDATIHLEEGSIYLDIENLDREKAIEIQTSDCGIFLLDKGVYRVNSSRDGRTEVLVMEGIAEVAGTDSSRNVRENQKIVMARGEVAERPYYFYASEKDDFDNWNEEQNRELGYARYGTSRYLQSGYEDYEYEMSRAGRWSYMSDFSSYVWIPYHTGADWRPYANGRWVWHPYYGYVWSSYDTCGWFTHHYGRWHWNYSHGWYWIPSYHWSPAWVSWFWDDYYYGWSPLSWWNRPIVIINNRWDRHYNYHRGIPHHSRSTIIIRKNELAAPNIHRVVVNKNALVQKTGLTIAYRGKAPADRPVLGKVTVINAKGKTVTYKQGGIVSTDKYRAQGSDIRTAVYKYDHSAAPAESSGTIRKKSLESSGSTFRSRTGGDASGVTGARDSSSGKAVYRSKSGSSSKSSSSSSSSSSSGTAKKKKGEPSYLSSTTGGSSGGSTQAATQTARFQGNHSFASNGSSRTTYRSYGSRVEPRDPSGSTMADTASRRVFSSRAAVSGGYSAPSFSYRSRLTGSNAAAREGSTLRSFSTSSTSHPSGSGRATGSFSSSASRSSSSSSSSTRASSSSSSRSSSRSSSSSSSSSSSGTAKKKN